MAIKYILIKMRKTWACLKIAFTQNSIPVHWLDFFSKFGNLKYLEVKHSRLSEAGKGTLITQSLKLAAGSKEKRKDFQIF